MTPFYPCQKGVLPGNRKQEGVKNLVDLSSIVRLTIGNRFAGVNISTGRCDGNLIVYVHV